MRGLAGLSFLARQALYLAWLHPLTLPMRSFWFDPYLWIHLAGLAALPLFLEGCLLGFAVGDPLLPVWLELLLVVIAGSMPILWMQWQRPFYIFSLMAVTVKPERLTDNQRRLLVWFKSPRNRVLATLVPMLLVVLLWKIYEIAPIAASSVSFLPQSRVLGLLLAAVAFLACNLFVQVPVSVASVMLTRESAFVATPPQPLESIRRSFTLVGLQLNQLLPLVKPDVKPLAAIEPPVTASAATTMSASTQAPAIVDRRTHALGVEATAPTLEAAEIDSDAEATIASDRGDEPEASAPEVSETS